MALIPTPPGGKLNHRVAVQAPAETPDLTGQPVPAWATETTVWGKYVPLAAHESEAAGGQVRGLVTGVVWVRRLDGLTPKKRLSVTGWGVATLILNVVGVEPPDPETGMQMVLVSEPEAGQTL